MAKNKKLTTKVKRDKVPEWKNGFAEWLKNELVRADKTPKEKQEFIKACGLLLNLPEAMVTKLSKDVTKPLAIRKLSKGLLSNHAFEVVKVIIDHTSNAVNDN